MGNPQDHKGRELSAEQDRFKADEKVFAFLDDVYVTCAPERVWEVHLRRRFSPTPR